MFPVGLLGGVVLVSLGSIPGYWLAALWGLVLFPHAACSTSCTPSTGRCSSMRPWRKPRSCRWLTSVPGFRVPGASRSPSPGPQGRPGALRAQACPSDAMRLAMNGRPGAHSYQGCQSKSAWAPGPRQPVTHSRPRHRQHPTKLERPRAVYATPSDRSGRAGTRFRSPFRTACRLRVICRHFVMPEEGLEPPTRGL